MRYLDDNKLTQIKEAILSLSTNGLQIHCLLELYQCQTDLQEETIIGHNMQRQPSTSSSQTTSSLIQSLTPHSQMIQAFPEIAMRERQNRKSYMYLSQCLANIFANVNVYDILTPACFYEMNYEQSLAAIDSTLMMSLNNYSQIQRYLMLAISDSCPPEQTRVYTVDLSSRSFNFFEGADGVWSQNFMFYNVFKHRILLFALKAVPEHQDNMQNDMQDNQNEEDYDQQRELGDENEYNDAFPQGSKFFYLL